MVEDDERLAHTLLQEGLEEALRLQEYAIEGIPVYVADGEATTAEQDIAEEAARVIAAEIKTNADAAWATEKRRLFGVHHEARKAVDEWKASLELMKERNRQSKQRGPLIEAIKEV
jgi:hypothetical protein